MSGTGGTSAGVNVSVEVPLENQVFEITYEGQEILQPPLSMSENLSKLAHRIDFAGKEDEGLVASAAGEGRAEDGKEKEKDKDKDKEEDQFKSSPTWPWENVRTKLTTALTELSVLGDIIAIAQKRNYLILDPVHTNPDQLQMETKSGAVMLYKKKSLISAAQVLMNGAEKLRLAMAETKSKSAIPSLPDFHIQLLRLRQNWRLRKVGNSILGDLSYRTAGSRFPQTGIFEVKKAEDNPDEVDLTDEASGSQLQPKIPSALKVVVPNELQGTAYIGVVIQKDQETLSFADISLPPPAPSPQDTHWQQKLEAAQNVLFCRELFSVLAREAVVLNSMPIPPLVVGNQITATLFPGILLTITLCHSISSEKKGGSGTASNIANGTNNILMTPKLEHNNAVLEHSLHQLLREVHRSNSCIPLPHPASAPIGISKRRRLAGPLAYDRQTLLTMSKKEGILEEIIRQSQHVVLRLRTAVILDALSREIRDPLIICHWSSINAVAHTCVRVNLITSGYDVLARTPLIVHVKEKSLKAILRDGKAIHLSYDLQELRDLILSQIAIHQVMSLQTLCKCTGWTVLSSNTHLGVGTCEPIGNAAGCVLSSPNGKRQLAIRSSPQTLLDGIQVHIGYPPNSVVDGLGEITEDVHMTDLTTTPSSSSSNLQNGSHHNPSDTNKDNNNMDLNLTSTMVYKPVKLDRLEGKNFLNKIEILMAVLRDAE